MTSNVFGMSSQVIKTVGIVGFGSISNRHCRNIKSLFPDSMIVGMSSSGKNPSQPENIDLIVKSIDELLVAQPDFVIIASPSTFHHEHCLKFLENKIPLLVEKPIFATLDKVDEFPKIESAFAVAYCLRFLPSSKIVKSFLEQGKLGTLLNIDTNVGQFLPEWRTDTNYKDSVSASKKLGGGVLLELSHEIDMISWLLGDMKLLWSCLRKTSELETDVEQIADLVFDVNGSVCNMHLDFLQKSPKRFYTFTGSLGRLEWNVITKEVVFFTKESKEMIYSEPNFDSNNMYLDMLKNFSLGLNGSSHDLCTFDEATNIVSLVEKAKQINTNKECF